MVKHMAQNAFTLKPDLHPESGELNTQVVFDNDGKIHIVNSQDCQNALDEAAAFRSAGAFGSPDMRFKAEIPVILAEKELDALGVDETDPDYSEIYHEVVCMIANSPDYQKLRVWEGQSKYHAVGATAPKTDFMRDFESLR